MANSSPVSGSKDWWLDRSIDAARIDGKSWDPKRGYDQNRPIVVNVYDYYRDVYLNDNKLKWMGLGRLAGGVIYGALEVMGTGRLQLLIGKDTTILPKNSIADLQLKAVAEAMDWIIETIQVYFLEMQKAIFLDVSWQHQAFIEGGLQTLEPLLSESSNPSRRIEAWRKLASASEDDNFAGATTIFEDEQLIVLNDWYTELRNVFTAKLGPFEYPFLTKLLSAFAFSPVPGGASFLEFYSDVDRDPDFSLFSDRWLWLKDEVLPSYRDLGVALTNELVAKPLDVMGDTLVAKRIF